MDSRNLAPLRGWDCDIIPATGLCPSPHSYAAPRLERANCNSFTPSSAAEYMRPALKHVLQSELNDAWIAIGQTTGAADVALNFSEGALVYCRDGKPGIQVVRKIKRFATHLDRLSFRDAESPGDGHIQLEQSRSLNEVSRHVAKGARRRND